MMVDRTFVNHETRYELRGDTGEVSALVYSAEPDEPATWQILLPGRDGIEDLYGSRQTPTPDADWLQGWLTPIIGGQAAELAAAVDAAPPHSAAWGQHDNYDH